MKLFLIAAVAHKRVIGNKGSLPWHIPEDLHRFKALTSGHTVLMGRKTYESLGKPLSHRRNVVLSSKSIDGVETYPSLALAFEAIKNEEKVFVIGGGEIFAQTLEVADAVYLTSIDQAVGGDTFFPPYEDILRNEFHVTQEVQHNGFSFLTYTRKIKKRK